MPLNSTPPSSSRLRRTEIPYDAKATAGQIEKRLIERQRSLYRKNNLEGLLALGRVESMALPGENYKLALTSGLLDVFRAKATPGEMRSILSGAQYRDLDGDGPFWIPSGQAFYSPDVDDNGVRELAYARAHFFLPHRFRDPFGNTTIVAYDEKYNLSLVYTRDAAGNETASEPDYRVLQPRKVTDPNGNRAEARFDALGMLAGSALLGKALGPRRRRFLRSIRHRPHPFANQGVLRRGRPARLGFRTSWHRDYANPLRPSDGSRSAPRPLPAKRTSAISRRASEAGYSCISPIPTD